MISIPDDPPPVTFDVGPKIVAFDGVSMVAKAHADLVAKYDEALAKMAASMAIPASLLGYSSQYSSKFADIDAFKPAFVPGKFADVKPAPASASCLGKPVGMSPGADVPIVDYTTFETPKYMLPVSWVHTPELPSAPATAAAAFMPSRARPDAYQAAGILAPAASRLIEPAGALLAPASVAEAVAAVVAGRAAPLVRPGSWPARGLGVVAVYAVKPWVLADAGRPGPMVLDGVSYRIEVDPRVDASASRWSRSIAEAFPGALGGWSGIKYSADYAYESTGTVWDDFLEWAPDGPEPGKPAKAGFFAYQEHGYSLTSEEPADGAWIEAIMAAMVKSKPGFPGPAHASFVKIETANEAWSGPSPAQPPAEPGRSFLRAIMPPLGAVVELVVGAESG